MLQTASHRFDAIVVGSGITGGWAAKELCERGLRTLVLEAGRDIMGVLGQPESLHHLHGAHRPGLRPRGGAAEPEGAVRVWGRREFLAAAGSVCGVLKGSALRTRHPAGAGQLGTIGIQLYTVREALRHDPEGTLTKVAAIGFKEVEFAGYPMSSVKGLRALLDRLGLSAPSGHVDVRAMREDWSRTLEAAAELGQRYVVCAWLPAEERRTLDQYRRFGALFDRAGETARKAGLQLCYHNHDFEFTRLEGRLPYDVLLEATDPRLVELELDLFWITKGGQDPLAYFKRYPGRFPLLHVKDMDRGAVPGFTEVGRGSIDFKRVFARAEQAGIRHYLYEQDSTRGSPFESARVSYEYLRKLQF